MEIEHCSAKETLEVLKRLQALDSKILHLRKEAKRKPEELAAKRAQLQESRERYSQKMKEIQECKKKIDYKELDLSEKEEETKKLEIRLNTAKTNKEYSAIITQINGIKADSSLLEEEILKYFDELDELTKVGKELGAGIKEEEREFEEFSRKNQQEKEELDKELFALDKNREELGRDIDKAVLDTYTKVLESKEGLAIVPVRDGICHGCFMKVTTNDIARMMKGDSLFRCRTCARILYLE